MPQVTIDAARRLRAEEIQRARAAARHTNARHASIVRALRAAQVTNLRHAALRTAAAAADRLTVDVEAGIIFGAAVACAGVCVGHGFSFDTESLRAICDLIAAEADGVKCRIGHPGRLADGTYEDDVTRVIGRVKNPRMAADGLSVRADVVLGDYARTVPELGDVRAYILSRAQQDPASFGLSIVMSFDTEIIDDGFGSPSQIVARPIAVMACDVVGRGAATSERGLLSAGSAGDNFATVTDVYPNANGFWEQLACVRRHGAIIDRFSTDSILMAMRTPLEDLEAWALSPNQDLHLLATAELAARGMN